MRFEKDWGRLGLKLSDWKKVKLSELGTIVGGGTPSTKKEEYYGGDIPWITPKDLANFGERYIEHGSRNITLAGLENSSAKILPVGSILFSSRAPIGYIAIASNNVSTNQGFKSIIPNSDVDSLFLYYLLKFNKDKIENMGSGTTFKEVSASIMKSIEVFIPTEIVEQRKISAILGAIDDKIENNKKINHHLAAISKNYLKIFHSNNSIKLGDLFELKSGYAFKSKDWVDEGKPVIKIKDIDGITIDITNLNYVKNKSQLAKASNFEVFGKEIVMALTGATTGKIGVIPKNFKGYVNQRVGLFYAKTELSYAVLWSILQQQNIITDLIELSSGSAQANLSPSSVNSYDLNVTLKDLIELDKIISPLYELFCFNLSEIQRLSELRDTLLPKLLSGELSVNQATK
ncbi:type I restriction modification DNA specificity family protein [Streptococcus sanguinis SK1087]|uniref:Type I restriction modification DNA specificity family protein n=1 Tax=Streptococcus sanguinis SK1087 TaxID=888824 RepID=F3SGH7_STRSA|nr:type I restriction modification DNA specificity family protein [Streptococcus sanguinis SK1087]